MNQNFTQPHPPFSSRVGAAAVDPVLAALSTRFSFQSGDRIGVIRILFALLGVAMAIAGVVIVVGEELHVAIGAGLIFLGVMIATPLVIKVILPDASGGKWLEISEPGTQQKLTAIRLATDGGTERAAELYRIFTSSQDANHWPQLRLQYSPVPHANPQLSTSSAAAALLGTEDVNVMIYRRKIDPQILMSLWVEAEDGAHSWPLIEPSATGIEQWLLRIAPRPNSSSDQSANMPYLHD